MAICHLHFPSASSAGLCAANVIIKMHNVQKELKQNGEEYPIHLWTPYTLPSSSKSGSKPEFGAEKRKIIIGGIVVRFTQCNTFEYFSMYLYFYG